MTNSMLRHNRGTVLVLSLLILLVLTIVGVASMSNVLMQERMAGNVNLQSLAFEAASAGISEALQFGIKEIEDRGDRIGDCSAKSGSASNPKEDPWEGVFVEIGQLEMDDDALHGITVHYSLKTDCLKLPQLVDSSDGTISVERFESYVTSRGEVRQADGTVLAAREVEVRIDSFRSDALSAMRVEGESEIEFDAGNSASFVMDGAGGPAISTSTPANSAIISQDLADKNRVQNFVGGVGTTTYPPPFHDGAELAKFVLRIRAYMEHFIARGVPLPNCDGFQMNYVNGNLALGGSDTFHGITYVTGNVTMGGNPSGSGLLIVEGTVQWRGTADFEGMVINLGGQFTMSGGGTGETKGMIYNTDLDLDQLRLPATGDEGTYKLYDDPDDLEFTINPVVDPWFDALVVTYLDAGDNEITELYNPSVHDPMGVDPYLVPGLVSKLDTIPSFPDDDDFRGLAYHKIYSNCNHDSVGAPTSWLNGIDSDGFGEHSCKGDDDGFGSTRIIFDGGGGHEMVYDCNMTDEIRLALAACPLPSPCPNPYDFSCIDPDDWQQPVCDPADPKLRKNCNLAFPWPDPECDIPGRGGRIEAITSWRENIGWREALE